jgi:hypothetical protein
MAREEAVSAASKDWKKRSYTVGHPSSELDGQSTYIVCTYADLFLLLVDKSLTERIALLFDTMSFLEVFDKA